MSVGGAIKIPGFLLSLWMAHCLSQGLLYLKDRTFVSQSLQLYSAIHQARHQGGFLQGNPTSALKSPSESSRSLHTIRKAGPVGWPSSVSFQSTGDKEHQANSGSQMMGTGDDIKGSRLIQQERNPIDKETILCYQNCKNKSGAGETAPRSRVCIMLCVQDLSAAPSIHI